METTLARIIAGLPEFDPGKAFAVTQDNKAAVIWPPDQAKPAEPVRTVGLQLLTTVSSELPDWIENARRRLEDDSDAYADVDLLRGLYAAVTGDYRDFDLIG